MTSLPRRLGASMLLVVALGSAVSACSSSLDNDKVTKALTTFYEKGDPGSKVTSVKCPDSPKAEKGTTFTCTFALKTGESGAFKVKVKNSDGDITFTVSKPARAVIDVAKAEQLISADLAKGGQETQDVSCPDPIPGTLGVETPCDVTLVDGTTGKAIVTVTDIDGNLDVRYE